MFLPSARGLPPSSARTSALCANSRHHTLLSNQDVVRSWQREVHLELKACIMTTPGRDKKDKRKAQAVEADKAGTVATAGEKGETVGDADPPKEPAPAANPSTAEPNRPLKVRAFASQHP
eukprot:754252-Pelagomonas_calceolata.AAC.1